MVLPRRRLEVGVLVTAALLTASTLQHASSKPIQDWQETTVNNIRRAYIDAGYDCDEPEFDSEGRKSFWAEAEGRAGRQVCVDRTRNAVICTVGYLAPADMRWEELLENVNDLNRGACVPRYYATAMTEDDGREVPCLIAEYALIFDAAYFFPPELRALDRAFEDEVSSMTESAESSE